MISPAVAIPSPLRRPILRRMFAFDICPRMMAGMPAKIERHKRDKIPRMRLAVALPSVCWADGDCCCPKNGWGCGGYCDACCEEAGGTFSHADVDAGLGVLGCCGAGGGGVGAACTGVAHCGQTVASSGMEAPHLKQNIHTSLGFRQLID
jgi:hypothetical protein